MNHIDEHLSELKFAAEKRDYILNKLSNYDYVEIEHAREVLSKSNDFNVSLDDLLLIADRVSSAIDHHFSDFENDDHILRILEIQLIALINYLRSKYDHNNHEL